MAEHLKVLDCDRKAVLALPHAAFKLWVCYWMNEDDDRESFVSQPEIRVQSNLSITSIVNWTKWLVRHGWLVDTGKTAYEKFLALGRIPSDNSKQVKVYRVEDPTTRTSVVGAPLQNLEGDTTTKNVNKVSGSRSGSSSVSDSPSRSYRESSSSSLPDSGEVGEQAQPQNGNQEPKTVEPKPTLTKAAGKKIRVPEGFDSWSLEDRLEWSRVNRGTGSSTMQPKPKTTPPASGDSRLCIECNDTPCRNTTSDYCEDCWLERQMAEAKSFEL